MPVLVLAAAILGLAVPSARNTAIGGEPGPVTEVSRGCPGQNAEVVQATGAPDYVYEAWIGCGGEAFARSVDGGARFQPPTALPDSSGSDDPALAVSAGGIVYASYLRYSGGFAYPVVATSFDHGSTFSQVSSLIPSAKGNWGDRDFIAAGRDGTVYVTWDYGPSAAGVKFHCHHPAGSCTYGAVDATAVIQKSSDYGKTWGPIIAMQPGFPAGGGYDASILVQPGGAVDALIQDHPIDRGTFTVHPGHEVFTSSSDGGVTWSPAVEVGGGAGSVSDAEWWIDGDLGTDRAGNLYATWDTQTEAGDAGWIAYSTNHGRAWSTPIRVTQYQRRAVHNVEVVGTTPGTASVAWQADDSPEGYATSLRPFSIAYGWLAPAIRVSNRYGNDAIWPGDTFGLSVLPTSHRSRAPVRVALSWGSAVGGSPHSEIYSAVVSLPARVSA